MGSSANGELGHCQGHRPVLSYLIPNASRTADNSTTPITNGTRIHPIDPPDPAGSRVGVATGSAATETTGDVETPAADVLSTVLGGRTEALALATGLNTNPIELSVGKNGGPWLPRDIGEGGDVGGGDELGGGGLLRVGVGDGGGLADGLGEGVGVGEGLGLSDGVGVSVGLGSSDGFGSATVRRGVESFGDSDATRRCAAAYTTLPAGMNVHTPTIKTTTASPLRIGSLWIPIASGERAQRSSKRALRSRQLKVRASARERAHRFPHPRRSSR